MSHVALLVAPDRTSAEADRTSAEPDPALRGVVEWLHAAGHQVSRVVIEVRSDADIDVINAWPRRRQRRPKQWLNRHREELRNSAITRAAVGAQHDVFRCEAQRRIDLIVDTTAVTAPESPAASAAAEAALVVSRATGVGVLTMDGRASHLDLQAAIRTALPATGPGVPTP